jgi:hypothetical protein
MVPCRASPGACREGQNGLRPSRQDLVVWRVVPADGLDVPDAPGQDSSILHRGLRGLAQQSAEGGPLREDDFKASRNLSFGLRKPRPRVAWSPGGGGLEVEGSVVRGRGSGSRGVASLESPVGSRVVHPVAFGGTFRLRRGGAAGAGQPR